MSYLGKILYEIYYKPRYKKRLIKSYGGTETYNLMIKGEEEMRAYALKDMDLSIQYRKNAKFKLNFLTGEKFLHQTIFCVYSFFKYLSPEEANNFSVTLFDDNSLSPKSISLIAKKFPGICLIPFQNSMQSIRQKLPAEDFPYIHKKLKELVLFKKIFMTHTQEFTGLQIFLDSDMLFFSKPIEILQWLEANSHDKNRAFALEDVKQSYGYSQDALLKLHPDLLRYNINSGLTGIHTEAIDFQAIENNLKFLEENYGSSYYMEQLMTAIELIKHPKLYMLPKSSYIVYPKTEDVLNRNGTLHHYVNISKFDYFTKAWKKIL